MPSSWLSPKLSVGRSDVDGRGLFAVQAIDEAELCCELRGVTMTDAEFAEHLAGLERYSALAIDEGRHLVQPPDDPAAMGNHSCDPNLWLADAVTVVARREIAPGDEATIDYALLTVDPTWSMRCRCGTAACRGVIRGDDWRRPDLRRRYASHWSPFIERRIRSA